MKIGKNKKRRRQQQPQSGRPVLLTFYVARPARDGGAAATASQHETRRGWKQQQQQPCKVVDGRPYNRRAELLEYSRQLRALARQTTATAAATQPPRPPGRDTNTAAGVVPDAGRRPAAESRLLSLAGRRQDRARSQQQIKQLCFGGGWSWKRVLVLVFPFHSSSSHTHNNVVSMRPRRGHGDVDRESDKNNNQKGWPATLLVGKLTVSKANHNGLGKKLVSIFRQRS